MSVAKSSSQQSRGCTRRVLISLTSSVSTPAGPLARDYSTQSTVGWFLEGKYASTTYHRFHQTMIMKITTFYPYFIAPSTCHTDSSFQTMAIPSIHPLLIHCSPRYSACGPPHSDYSPVGFQSQHYLSVVLVALPPNPLTNLN